MHGQGSRQLWESTFWDQGHKVTNYFLLLTVGLWILCLGVSEPTVEEEQEHAQVSLDLVEVDSGGIFIKEVFKVPHNQSVTMNTTIEEREPKNNEEDRSAQVFSTITVRVWHFLTVTGFRNKSEGIISNMIIKLFNPNPPLSGSRNTRNLVMYPFIVLLLTSASLVIHHTFFRMLKNSHEAEKLYQIYRYATDISRIRETDAYLIFTMVSQRRPSNKILYRYMHFVYFFRGVLTICLLAVTSFEHITGDQRRHPVYKLQIGTVFALSSIQLACCGVGLAWLVSFRSPSFTHLMRRYVVYLTQVDIARGRSVPAPPRHKAVHPLLPPLNPYMTCPSTRLLLDLLATVCGPGAALRVLATLEADVESSWRITGLTIELKSLNALAVYWKDPPVLGYLPSTSLSISYGIELDILGEEIQTAVLSNQEMVFMKQTWTNTNKEKISPGCPQDLVYHHVFPVASPDLLRSGALVRVWTVVHGQLITASRQVLANLYVEENPQIQEDLVSHRSETETDAGMVNSDAGQDMAITDDTGMNSAENINQIDERTTPSRSPNRVPKPKRLDKFLKPKRIAKQLDSRRSASESNLVIKERKIGGKFIRRSCDRQSLPHGSYVNHGLEVPVPATNSIADRSTLENPI